MRILSLGFVCGLLALTVHASAACVVRDFLTDPLPSGDPVEVAMETGFPGTDLDLAAGVLMLADGRSVPWAPARGVAGAAALDQATAGDMFAQRYPLTFDMTARLTPWFDPGRARNDAVFRALYGDSPAAVEAQLVPLRHDSGAVFAVTQSQCAATQLEAVLADPAARDPAAADWFRDVGGSFNWRVIAGTDRLSSHAFGAAIDLNAGLGGYWRWANRPEGDAGAFDTTIPPDLVAAFERRGFIWGGKWHHYDGMHFEYRPDLIIHARLTGP